jgi:phosphoacetylglucosamine mutase
MKSSLVAALQLYPRQSKQLAYGTAGFRENASLPLNSVFLRMGILGGLRSQSVGSKCIGLMVTASHNPECDNGVKLVDHDGGMMTQSWEPYAIEIANIAEASDVVAAIDRIATTVGVTDPSTPSVIVIGRDTRPHSAELAECITKGAKAFGAVVFDMGLVTTPQLHFIVQQANKKADKFPISTLDRTAALQEYYDTIGAGYIALRDSANFTVDESSAQVCRSLSDVIVVDGSNGIGSIAIKETAVAVNAMRPGLLHVDIRNEAYAGPVNEGCGAEFVQKGQLPPKGVDKDADSGLTLCSFDGDADRIVFHSYLKTEGSMWVLLDGDKIAAVMSVLIARELEASGLDKEYHMGVVQTAYANGASTMFLKENKVTVVMAKTGVKFLHHKALHFDIGVYFEANGHGTVLFSEKLLNRLDSWVDPDVNNHDRALVAMRRLKVGRPFS